MSNKYHEACVLGIRSIDDVYYGKKAPDQIRVLRRVLDLILNKEADLKSWSDDPTIDRAKKIEGVVEEKIIEG